MSDMDAVDEEPGDGSHGQLMPPSPTPTPAPYFKGEGSTAEVAYTTLTSTKRSEEQKAILISHIIQEKQQTIYKLEDSAALDSEIKDSQSKLITELKEKVARLEGTIELLREQSSNIEFRWKEKATREKAALMLAGLLIPLGIQVLDKSGSTGTILIIVGGICALAGIFPKVMGIIFKDTK